jgi:hypothetical protein
LVAGSTGDTENLEVCTEMGAEVAADRGPEVGGEGVVAHTGLGCTGDTDQRAADIAIHGVGEEYFDTGVHRAFNAGEVVAGGITIHLAGAITEDNTATPADDSVSQRRGDLSGCAVFP